MPPWWFSISSRVDFVLFTFYGVDHWLVTINLLCSRPILICSLSCLAVDMIILTLFAVNYGLADFGLNTIARHLVGISFKITVVTRKTCGFIPFYPVQILVIIILLLKSTFQLFFFGTLWFNYLPGLMFRIFLISYLI